MPSAKRPVRKSSSPVKAKAGSSAKARAGRTPPRTAARKPGPVKAVKAKSAASRPLATKASPKKVVKPATAIPQKTPKAGKLPPAKAQAPGRQAKAIPAKVQPPPLREMVVRSTPGLVRTSGRKPLRPLQNSTRRLADQYDPDALIHGIRPYKAKPGEAYMNPTQLDHFRQILKAWRRELMEEVDRTVHHMQDEASNFPDPNDRATQESEFGLELRTRDRERKLLKKIDSALERIGDRAYGYCEETGEEIGLKRLEARPVATLSLEAQERREMAERQYGEREDHYR